MEVENQQPQQGHRNPEAIFKYKGLQTDVENLRPNTSIYGASVCIGISSSRSPSTKVRVQ